MTSKRPQRTVPPNGQEIRRLRLAKGQTQEEFVKGGGITQRTLQRAEQGERIGSQHISVIAKRLEVPSEQIVKETADNKQPDAQKDAIIILEAVKGRQLIEWLQAEWGPDDVEYSFDVDPGSEVSELIAGVIEFCNQCRLRNPDSILGPAEKIRAIGVLNDKLAELNSRQVDVFASDHYFWRAELKKNKETGVYVWTPHIKSRVLIGFGSVDALSMTEREHRFYTKQSVFKECARNNFKNRIDPEIPEMKSLFVDNDFHSFYRTYWDARRAELPIETKMITLVPQE